MKYKKIRPYKYIAVSDETIYLDFIDIDFEVYHEHISIRNKYMTTTKGYPWNGSDGPTIDTKNSMKPSRAHDPLCELVNLGLLDSKYRKQIDKLYYDICLEEGMNPFRAWYQHKGIRFYQRNKKELEKLETDYNKVIEV